MLKFAGSMLIVCLVLSSPIWAQPATDKAKPAQGRTLMDDTQPADSAKASVPDKENSRDSKPGLAKSSTVNKTNHEKSSAAGAVTTDPARNPPSSLASQSEVGGAFKQSDSQTADQSNDQATNHSGVTAGPSLTELVIRPLGATLLVCALAIGALMLYRRYSGGGRRQAQDAPVASVLTTLPLGDKRSVTIVRVGEQVLVLGNTPQSITLLTQMAADLKPAPAVELAPVANARPAKPAVESIEDFNLHLIAEMENKNKGREPQFARVRQSLLGI